MVVRAKRSLGEKSQGNRETKQGRDKALGSGCALALTATSHEASEMRMIGAGEGWP